MTEQKTANQATALRINIWALRFTRNWLRIALTILGIYATLPFVAPTLMYLGLEGPARVIYTLYSPFCHQFAFRSFFLHGEQPVYPREAARTNWEPYEARAAADPNFQEHYTYWYQRMNDGRPPESITADDLLVFTPWLQWASRDFLGNPEMGYKTTLCMRDMAIYSMLFAGGLIYSLGSVRRRLRPVPIWLYVILGLGPMGIDGVSQLLSYPPFQLWEVRETMPFFRVITGALFGLMNAWLVFPYLDRSLQDTRYQLEAKLRRAGIRI